jgi:hypothetical protein
MRPLLRTLLKFPTGYDAGIKTRSNCGLVHIDPDKHNLGLTVTDDWIPALVKTSAILIGLEFPFIFRRGRTRTSRESTG